MLGLEHNEKVFNVSDQGSEFEPGLLAALEREKQYMLKMTQDINIFYICILNCITLNRQLL